MEESEREREIDKWHLKTLKHRLFTFDTIFLFSKIRFGKKSSQDTRNFYCHLLVICLGHKQLVLWYKTTTIMVTITSNSNSKSNSILEMVLEREIRGPKYTNHQLSFQQYYSNYHFDSNHDPMCRTDNIPIMIESDPDSTHSSFIRCKL